MRVSFFLQNKRMESSYASFLQNDKKNIYDFVVQRVMVCNQQILPSSRPLSTIVS
jgi:hypothetical protein